MRMWQNSGHWKAHSIRTILRLFGQLLGAYRDISYFEWSAWRHVSVTTPSLFHLVRTRGSELGCLVSFVLCKYVSKKMYRFG